MTKGQKQGEKEYYKKLKKLKNKSLKNLKRILDSSKIDEEKKKIIVEGLKERYEEIMNVLPILESGQTDLFKFKVHPKGERIEQAIGDRKIFIPFKKE